MLQNQHKQNTQSGKFLFHHSSLKRRYPEDFLRSKVIPPLHFLKFKSQSDLWNKVELIKAWRYKYTPP
jgi:hypothetical protein